MGLLEAIVLGVVQGLTEFVPVSSSGHLVLVPWLLGWSGPDLVFDTVVHWGTLVAVLAYFWRDWLEMLASLWRGSRRWDWSDPKARLVWLLILGTAPAIGAGLLLEDFFESLFGRPAWVSLFLLVTAAGLAVSEWAGRRQRTLEGLTRVDALLIGCAQALAIAPGISRSGATIAVGLLRGLERPAAARFSFLLATPAIFGAGVLQLARLVAEGGGLSQAPVLLAGFLAAAISGYFAIWGLLRHLESGRLYLFALYCVWVGISCLIVAWVR